MTDPATIAGTPEPTIPDDTPTDAPANDLDAVRAVVLRAHPEAVPELIAGDSIAALLASVEPAEAAYRRVAAALVATGGAATGAAIATAVAERVPPVPAGGDRPVALDPARLPASEKIRRGLRSR